MKKSITLFFATAASFGSFAQGPCPIAQQTLTSVNPVCSGRGTVSIAGSETGTYYYLRNNADNSIVAGPVEGTGSAISFTTNPIVTPTTYNVYAVSASGALDFERDVVATTDTYVSTGTGLSSAFAGTNQITVEAWVNMESMVDQQTIVGNYGPGTNGMQFLFRIDGGKPGFWVHNGSGFYFLAQGSGQLPLNTWVHVAATWDGTYARVYYNGVLTGSTFVSGTFPTTTNEVRIGANFPNESFDGKIDNLRIWNVAKTEAEINNDRSLCLTGAEPNLVALYNFDNITGGIVEDGTAYNRDGTFVGAPAITSGTLVCSACSLQMSGTVTLSVSPLTEQPFSPTASSAVCSGITAVNLASSDPGASYYLRDNTTNAVVAGPFAGTGGPITLSANVSSTTTFNVFAEKSGLLTSTGTALSFDGADDVVIIPGATTDFTNNDFTIEAWINTTGINEGILTKGDASNWNGGEKSFYIDATGHPVLVGYGNDFIIGGTAVNDGTWHHVAFTWNYAGSTGKVYIDGTESTAYDNYQSNMWDNVGNSLRLGSANFGGEAPNYFSGMMDEVRIWNTTRTASQVLDFMSACLSGNEPGLVAYYPFENETGTGVTDLTGGPETGALVNFAASPYVAGLGCGASCSLTMSALFTATVNAPADLALTQSISSVICNGNMDITTSTSEQGVIYSLRDNANDNVISGPVSGNGTPLTFNTGNITSTTTYNVFASKSSALNFDGVNDYVETPFVGITGAFTFESWIKTNDPTPEWAGIITTNTFSGTGMFVQFSLADNGTLRWESNSPNLYISNMTTVINDNVWHHVAVVSDGSSITFYVDGNLERTEAFAAGSIHRKLLFMAERQMGNLIPGKMDDARIWNVARTQTEIQSSMNACLTGAEQGLMIYYNFENNAGSSIVTDIAGGDQNGTMNNFDPMTAWVDGIASCNCTREMTATPTLTVNPVSDQVVTAAQTSFCDSGSTTIDVAASEATINYYLRNDLNDTIIAGPLAGTGSAISFSTGTISSTTTYNVFAENRAPDRALDLDGNDDYVSVPSGINLANQSFTIEFWAKRNNANAYNFVIGQGTGNPDDGLHIGFRDNNNFTFAFYGDDLDVATAAATDGVYHHWSCVYNAGISGTDRYIYLDGVLVASDNASGNYTGSGELKIGASPWGSESFYGTLDEVRIWTAARSQTEIQNNMNNCLSGTESNLLAYYTMNNELLNSSLADLTGNNNNGTLVNMNPPADWTTNTAPVICAYCSLELSQTATVTIKNSTSSSITLTECDSYTAPDMNVYITSGIVTAVITNTAGCDSTITIDLTINNSSSSVMNENACDSYTWAVNGTSYTTSGMYTATILNTAGCDSTIMLNLTINSVDASVSQSSNTLTANAPGAAYVWIDCSNGSAISGEASQSFTALANGDYAVVVTENGCTDTSACINISTVGIAQTTSGNNLSLYPNPTSGLIHISQSAPFTTMSVRLITVDGKSSTIEGNFSGSDWSFDMSNYAEGIYFIELSQKETVTRMKVIKN
ncbi:MAG: hypothetical protein JWO09_1884 [Bacteroidetes bacterium]|nr:hypothetical protein [Bacteroidota bacterium]